MDIIKIFISTFFLFSLTIFGQVQIDTLKSSDKGCASKFPGGDKKLFKFINDSLKWPSKDYYAHGKVYVKFMVDTLGQLQEPAILKGIDSLANTEALRVVKLLPKWTPPNCVGKHVNVWYTISMYFKVQ